MIKLNPSLRSRLWLVLALALLPLVALVIANHLAERLRAVDRIEREARLMLQGVRLEESAARRQVQQLLATMAGADNMRRLDPEDCKGLAQRLAQAAGDYHNIGAALPDGRVFCSSLPMTGPVTVSDRRWFQEGLTATGLTRGQFLLGRVSGQPVIVFGYPMRSAAGELQALLFASAGIAWFDRFTANYPLPGGWIALLFDADGRIVSRSGQPPAGSGDSLPAASQERLRAALQAGRGSVSLEGPDGIERLFVLDSLELASNELIVSVGAPIAQALAPAERQLRWQLGLLGLVAAHVLALHETGSNNPDGIEIKANKDENGIPRDGIPFHPYYTVKDIVGVIVFLMVFSAIVFFAPEMGGYFLEKANFVPADPLKTPEHIIPVWYFTPYYAILRAVPPMFGSQFPGVVVMGLAIMLLFFLPWLDRGKVKSIRYRGPIYKFALALFVISFVSLGYLGVLPATPVATLFSQVFTVIYFLFFLLMPWYTAIDKTKPEPERVTG